MFTMTESDLRAILGENLKKYRTFKGLSQAKLAEILDISPNFISDMETGKRWLSSDTLANLAEALDVEAYEFLRPAQALTSGVLEFIESYTEKAAKTASEEVARSLKNLGRQYMGNKPKT